MSSSPAAWARKPASSADPGAWTSANATVCRIRPASIGGGYFIAREGSSNSVTPVGRAVHIGEACAFADGPAVAPITLGQKRRAAELGWRFTSLDAGLDP